MRMTLQQPAEGHVYLQAQRQEKKNPHRSSIPKVRLLCKEEEEICELESLVASWEAGTVLVSQERKCRVSGSTRVGHDLLQFSLSSPGASCPSAVSQI